MYMLAVTLDLGSQCNVDSLELENQNTTQRSGRTKLTSKFRDKSCLGIDIDHARVRFAVMTP